jgi:hypothetical protein
MRQMTLLADCPADLYDAATDTEIRQPGEGTGIHSLRADFFDSLTGIILTAMRGCEDW